MLVVLNKCEMFKKFVTFFKTRKKYQVKVGSKIFRYRRPNILFLGVFEAVRQFLLFGWVDRIEILDLFGVYSNIKNITCVVITTSYVKYSIFSA